MKIIKFIAFGLILTIIFSCAVVHDRLQTGTVVRDCSGTYFRIEGKGDYQVCNEDILKEKQEGEKVSIIFDYTKDCKRDGNKIVCMLYHENDGMIQIKKVQ